MSVREKSVLSPKKEPILVPKRSEARVDWIDNLRSLMILLVVNMHACVTYSHVGDWYFNAPPDPPLATKVPFALWQAMLQSFFMGLLFFIAGYFADRSLNRKGPKAFMRDRVWRLGVPTLIYMLAIHPLIVIGLHPMGDGFDFPGKYYLHFVMSGHFIGSSGPMWFAFALLLFSAVFAGMKRSGPTVRPLEAIDPVRGRLTAKAILGLGIGLGVGSFLVRTVQPIGTNILNFQLCFFVQYIAAFVLGVGASRSNSLGAIAESPAARRAGWLGVILGPIFFVLVVVASGPLPKAGPPAMMGGWNPSALAYAVWEQTTGVALALGSMSLCAHWLRTKGPRLTWISDRAFGVYMIHAPVLVAITLLLQSHRTSAFVMVPVATILCLVATFLIADLVRRLPGAHRIL